MNAKCAVLAALIAVLSPEASLAEVKVNFIDPDHYTDANLIQRVGGRSAKEPAMRELEKTFRQLGGAYLTPDETLTIDVLDIDLAGRFEPWQYEYRDVRFMRGITWPSIKLRYTLESRSRPQNAEETVADKAYLTPLMNRDYIDTMPYEKLMLQRWFKARFGQRPAN